MKKPTVYIETSIVSYLVARPSRDALVCGQQLRTRDWWNDWLPSFRPVTSAMVLNESARGDPTMAKARVKALASVEMLKDCDEVSLLSAKYLKRIGLPDSLQPDAYHMAIASWYRVEYLATWNCKHIAAGWIRRLVKEVNEMHRYFTPEICTPLELMGTPK